MLGGLVIVVVVTAILGVRLSLARAAARPVPVTASDPATVSSTGSSSTPGSAPTTRAVAASAFSSPTASSATSAELVVYVSGRVRHPGVVHLPPGSRVQDALRVAGGALAGSDLESINLAQPLTDGEQVRVARAGRGSSVSMGGGLAGGSVAAGPAGTASGQVVDLNTGDATALDSLPGVGPVLAQRIVDWRTAHGRFSSVDELDEVSGIGDKLLSELRPHVRV